MPYLLDTNVISELRKPKPHGGVTTWVRKIPEESLFVCAVTLGVIQAGIEITRALQPDPAAEIEKWLDDESTRASCNISASAQARRVLASGPMSIAAASSA